MKLVAKYSYEFNSVLNENFDESEQIKNFASLISDKDRFLPHIALIEKNAKLIGEKLGFELPEEIVFYVVRAEKFKSFSEPVTIEYSLLPEEMIVFLLKEVIKNSIKSRFPDEIIREKYVNSFVNFVLVHGDFGDLKLIKFGKNLHEESKRMFCDYRFEDVDFSSKTMKEYIEEMYN